jgi:Domain of unknown function (DUF4333)
MHRGKYRVLVGLVAVAAGGVVAGCSASAHVSFGGTPTVARHAVETEIATKLAKQENQPVPKVVCPGNLTGKVGAVMYCSLTAKGSTTAYPVKLQVDSVKGGTANFNIQVSKTPGHFTS